MVGSPGECGRRRLLNEDDGRSGDRSQALCVRRGADTISWYHIWAYTDTLSRLPRTAFRACLEGRNECGEEHVKAVVEQPF